MLLIQPRCLLRRDEKLRAVGVGPRVRHADRVRLVVFQRGELVGKLGTPDAFAAGAIAKGIATLRDGGGGGVSEWQIFRGGREEGGRGVGGRVYLDHEFADHAVEDGVVVIAVFGMRDEVLDCFRGGLRKKPDMNVAVGGV